MVLEVSWRCRHCRTVNENDSAIACKNCRVGKNPTRGDVTTPSDREIQKGVDKGYQQHIDSMRERRIQEGVDKGYQQHIDSMRERERRAGNRRTESAHVPGMLNRRKHGPGRRSDDYHTFDGENGNAWGRCRKCGKKLGAREHTTVG